jgi:hypothetical protein
MAVIAFAMHTWSWDIANICVREGLAIGQFINTHPGNAQQLVGFILFKRDVVLRHAGNHASATSVAFVQVNDHSVFFISPMFHRNLVGIANFYP